MTWRGVLRIPSEELWAYPIGLFEDMIATRQIMDGAEEGEAPKKQSINYEDDSVWDLL